MNSSRCAACKHLRRRCPSECIFSPYFPSNNPRRFAYVHKIYGASNVGKILQDLPVNRRGEAADTLYYEAYCRIKEPVYGCVGMVTILHQQIYSAQCQLARIQAEIAALALNRNTDTHDQYHHQFPAHEPAAQQFDEEDIVAPAAGFDPSSFPPDQNHAISNNSASFYDLSTWFN